MKNILLLIISVFTIGNLYAQNVKKLKKELLTSIDKKSNELITLSDNIWEAAEVAFREDKSADYLIK